jgi:signal transduction histidine kinase/ligand-binding sensor domain-containing protein
MAVAGPVCHGVLRVFCDWMRIIMGTGSVQWVLVWWLACLSWAWAGPTAPFRLAKTSPALATATTPATFDFSLTPPRFETVGDAHAIPGQTITALAQDARGFLWIGTQQGLIRYDGYRFRKFEYLARDPASLSGDYVFSLWAAPDGKVWVGTFNNGVAVFDPATEQFQRFTHNPAQAGSIGDGRISALLGDGKGGMWFATGQGLDYLPPNSQVFAHLRHEENNPVSLLSDQVNCLLRDSRGRLWVGSTLGLQRLGVDDKTFELIASDAYDHTQPERHNIQALIEAQDGKIWVGTRSHGAAWLLPDSSQLHWLPFEAARQDVRGNAWIRGMVQTQPDQIWLASHGGGIDVVAASDGRVVQRLRHDATVANSLAFDQVKPFLIDRAGSLWVGTWGEGLQRVAIRHAMVRELRYGQSPGQGLSHPDVRSILPLANGQILFGSSGNGIDIFEPGVGLVGGYRAAKEGARPGLANPGLGSTGLTSPGLASPESLPEATILALAQTKDGSLWAAMRHAGLVRRAADSKSWQAMPGLAAAQISRLLATRDGGLWVGSNRGLAYWKNGRTRLEPSHDRTGTALDIDVSGMVEDENGRIWVGSASGLWVLEPGSKNWLVIHPQRDQPDSLISDAILALLLDRKGRLWLSTDKGLERLRSWAGGVAKFEHIHAIPGQPGKSLGSNLMEDNRGRIWSDEMVLEMSADQAHLTAITKAIELDIAGSWPGSHSKTADGFLLFGNTNGVVMINPELVRPKGYAVPLVVTELKVNGQAQPLARMMQGPGADFAPTSATTSAPGTLILKPGQRNFALEFAVLDFVRPKDIRYQYRLLGYDKAWIDTDANYRIAAYGNLWPGQYTLQVRASNRTDHRTANLAGEWNPNELSIGFQIEAAWWQTWWFLTFGLMLLAGTIYTIYRWRIRFLTRLVAERTADILKLGEIGRELTSTLDTEQAFERVYRQVVARLDATVFSIAIYHEADQRIVFVYEIENGQRQPVSFHAMNERDRPAVWCVREKCELVVACNADLLNYVSTILPPSVGEPMETVVYLPLMIERQVIGCLSVQSSKAHAYDEDQLKFLQVLASYTAIALANSTTHDALTQAHDDLAGAHRSLQETQQQLVLKEKMVGLGTLTAGIAHEINNPTNFTHVAAQIQRVDLAEFQQFLLDLVDPAEEHEIVAAFEQRFRKLNENVTLMLNGTGRIMRIVQDLRAFTRLDEAEKKSVHLSECLGSIVHLVRAQWQDKVEFTTHFEPDPEIECWPALLNQVFMNLLINGCQAISEKQTQAGQRGKLSVYLQSEPGSNILNIVFEDNGIGIPANVQARIFEPFYTTREVGSGTGLGLSIAFGIVQKHGGSLSFTSTEGVGSQFMVSLPRREP